ncbi:glycosyl transferase [Clostridia bacterium]|nr:glycosyl transferase [Clostridia bacterium]
MSSLKDIVMVMPKFSGGGAERIYTTLANELSAFYRVTLFQERGFESQYTIHDRVVRKELYSRISGLPKNLSYAITILFSCHKNSLLLLFMCDKYLLMLLISLRSDLCVIVSQRNDIKELSSRRMVLIIRELLLQRSNLIVCQTTDQLLSNKKEHYSKSLIISNFVKDDLPVRENANKTIITFCRLTEQKNLNMLVDSMVMSHENYPQYDCRIYGQGELKDKLNEHIVAMNADKYIEILPYESNVHKYAANCFCYVSTSDYEGISNSMLEAMAIGLPVVCTDCDGGGARDVIDNGVNGILIEKKNKKQLVQTLCMLATQPDTARKLGEEAKKVKYDYSKTKIVNEWVVNINECWNRAYYAKHKA